MDNMRRYTFDRKQSWIKRVAECVIQYHAELGVVPNVARVSSFCKEYPQQVGPIKLVPGRGLFEWELELGIVSEKAQSAQQADLLSAPQDTTQPS
jgi:hypothetical protein